MGRMVLPRAVAALAMAATTTLVLAACGTSPDAGHDPSEAIPSGIGAPSSTGTPTSPTAGSTSSSPPASPTSTPTAKPTKPAASATTAQPARILDFQGIHLLLPVENSDLPGIPDGLRSALAAGLKKRWDAYGDAPACEKGPVYVVNKVDTGGWASIDSWDDPGVSGPKCSGIGGGYAGFWADVNGTWQEVIQTQELPQCAQFAKYHFPVAIAGDKCAQADGTEVAYAG